MRSLVAMSTKACPTAIIRTAASAVLAAAWFASARPAQRAASCQGSRYEFWGALAGGRQLRPGGRGCGAELVEFGGGEQSLGAAGVADLRGGVDGGAG